MRSRSLAAGVVLLAVLLGLLGAVVYQGRELDRLRSMRDAHRDRAVLAIQRAWSVGMFYMLDAQKALEAGDLDEVEGLLRSAFAILGEGRQGAFYYACMLAGEEGPALRTCLEDLFDLHRVALFRTWEDESLRPAEIARRIEVMRADFEVLADAFPEGLLVQADPDEIEARLNRVWSLLQTPRIW